MNNDQYLAAKKLHDAADKLFPPATTTPIKFENLPEEVKDRWAKLARIAADSTPAPIILQIEHIATYPCKGRARHISADVTRAGIDGAVEEFRTYITDLADEWKQAHAEPEV
jgi:hypothetical protein